MLDHRYYVDPENDMATTQPSFNKYDLFFNPLLVSLLATTIQVWHLTTKYGMYVPVNFMQNVY